MNRSLTSRARVGLLAGLGAAVTVCAAFAWSRAAASAPPRAAPPARSASPPAPTEQIDVELAVDFPYDI